MTSPPYPSSITFGSFLVYPSPVLTEDAKRAKTWILGLKADRVSHVPPLTLVEYAVRQVRRRLDETSLAEILRSDVTFVPMPRSAPLVRDAVWAPRSICIALIQTHFGRDWQPLIERVSACEKSASLPPHLRPKPIRHYETMRAAKSTVPPTSIVLVDDVVTRGTTFIAAAARLCEIYPDVPIAAFAVARTSSDFSKILEPCVGEIALVDPNTWPRRRDRHLSSIS